MAISIDFINEFTYLLHFYFSENAKVRNFGKSQKLVFQQFLANNHIELRSFNV